MVERLSRKKREAKKPHEMMLDAPLSRQYKLPPNKHSFTFYDPLHPHSPSILSPEL